MYKKSLPPLKARRCNNKIDIKLSKLIKQSVWYPQKLIVSIIFCVQHSCTWLILSCRMNSNVFLLVPIIALAFTTRMSSNALFHWKCYDNRVVCEFSIAPPLRNVLKYFWYYPLRPVQTSQRACCSYRVTATQRMSYLSMGTLENKCHNARVACRWRICKKYLVINNRVFSVCLF